MESSGQEKILIHEIKQKQESINAIFRQLQIKKSDIANESTNSVRQKADNTYFQKYQQSTKDIEIAYNEAWMPFKWLKLPFCKKIVFEKILFCIPANIFLLTTFYYWSKAKIAWTNKKIAAAYLGLNAVTWLLVFAESLYFQPYCDINSYHYNKNFSSLELARRLKNQYNNNNKSQARNVL